MTKINKSFKTPKFQQDCHPIFHYFIKKRRHQQGAILFGSENQFTADFVYLQQIR